MTYKCSYYGCWRPVLVYGNWCNYHHSPLISNKTANECNVGTDRFIITYDMLVEKNVCKDCLSWFVKEFGYSAEREAIINRSGEMEISTYAAFIITYFPLKTEYDVKDFMVQQVGNSIYFSYKGQQVLMVLKNGKIVKGSTRSIVP